MARVTVLPLGVEIEVEDGETVFHAAIAQGYRWPTVCEGLGSCRTCFMRVVDGGEHLAEPDDWEQEGLEDIAERSADGGHRVRLACQAAIHGDAVVRKTGVKPVPVPDAGDRDGTAEPAAGHDGQDSHADRRKS